MKKVLIPVTVLNDVADLLQAIRQSETDGRITEIAERIEDALILKLEAVERREAFSRYKTAPPNSEERERARKAYLDKAETSQNFTSTLEFREAVEERGG